MKHLTRSLLNMTIAIVAIASSALALTSPIHADSSWNIDRFHANIAIQEDGLVDITETITVNFRQNKHGIFRDLPHRYAGPNDKDIYTNIEVISVQKDGINEPYQQNSDRHYLQLKIGDSRIGDLRGNYTYTIRYRVEGILVGYPGYDELYWNVTGQDWDTAISQATVTITLPQEGIKQHSCYQGSAGSNDQCSATVMSTNKQIRFSATSALNQGQGMTVAVGYQKGMVPLRVVTPPSVTDTVIQYWEIIATSLTITILGLLAVFLLWYKRGRDWWWRTPQLLQTAPEKAILKPIGASHPVVVEYTPPQDLTPGLIGLLKDERADTLDITSSIIDLASRGYLTITELDKKWVFGSADYQLDRTDKSPDGLMEYEKLLLDRLFKSKKQVKLSSLKEKFYKDLADIVKALEEEGQRRQFFVKTPSTVVATYVVIAILLIVIGIIGIIILVNAYFNTWLLGLATGLIIPGIALLITAFHMPQKTAQGRHLWKRIKGYELFIKNAEEHRQKFFEQQGLFTEVLPYAMVFGLTDKFAKAMKDIGLEPQQPSWYRSSTAFNAALFASNMNAMSRAVSSTIASAPSSSGSGGGGSVGGGFGGGGGGSW